MRYEVRCCCSPQKLLGWAEAPEGAPTVTFLLAVSYNSSLDAGCATETITLPIDRIQVPGRPAYPAIKAERTSIETLRRIPGFIENGRNNF